MAGNSIRISTDQVQQIADSIERMNSELAETLAESRVSVDGLRNVWQGEAAEGTIEAFDSFADRYFQRYQDVIRQYVRFLRQNVGAGYLETENVNLSLADAFK